jgi:hypothetical protein
MSQVSQVKQTMQAYKEIEMIGKQSEIEGKAS